MFVCVCLCVWCVVEGGGGLCVCVCAWWGEEDGYV